MKLLVCRIIASTCHRYMCVSASKGYECGCETVPDAPQCQDRVCATVPRVRVCHSAVSAGATVPGVCVCHSARITCVPQCRQCICATVACVQLCHSAAVSAGVTQSVSVDTPQCQDSLYATMPGVRVNTVSWVQVCHRTRVQICHSARIAVCHNARSVGVP